MAGNVLRYSVEVYAKHLPLILLFSLSFIIAFLIPLFASFPTYNDLGGIFLRLTSVFSNLTVVSASVIIFATLFSLLFLSFAIVAINTIVKHSRTGTRIRKEVRDGLEKYTAKVFVVLLLYTVIVTLFNLLCFIYGLTPAIAAVIAIVLIPFFFYAPAAIVIDEKNIPRSLRLSAGFFVKRFDYALLWFVLAIVAVTVFDFLFIIVGGNVASSYALLVFNSLFIMPFLIVLQSQSYMSRFSLLKR